MLRVEPHGWPDRINLVPYSSTGNSIPRHLNYFDSDFLNYR